MTLRKAYIGGKYIGEVRNIKPYGNDNVIVKYRDYSTGVERNQSIVCTADYSATIEKGTMNYIYNFTKADL